LKYYGVKYDIAIDNLLGSNKSDDPNSTAITNKISQILRKNSTGFRVSSTNLPFDRLEYDAKIKSNFHAIGNKDIE